MTLNDKTQSALVGVNWLVATTLGPIGTAIAVLAVAALGLVLFQGRVPARRGAEVILGCFILFSARTIAAGLVVGGGMPPEKTIATAAPMPPAYIAPSPTPVPYDPYAGASVPIEPRDTTENIIPK